MPGQGGESTLGSLRRRLRCFLPEVGDEAEEGERNGTAAGTGGAGRALAAARGGEVDQL